MLLSSFKQRRLPLEIAFQKRQPILHLRHIENQCELTCPCALVIFSLENAVSPPSISHTMKFKVVIDRERCKGFELCVEVCSRHVLTMTKTLNAKGDHYAETLDLSLCTGCQQCALICPDAAIEIEVEDD
jgi:2-oxoglutarate ferredoxin oxidoreductase subunit delta